MEFELVDDGAYPKGDGLEVWRLGPVLLLCEGGWGQAMTWDGQGQDDLLVMESGRACLW